VYSIIPISRWHNITKNLSSAETFSFVNLYFEVWISDLIHPIFKCNIFGLGPYSLAGLFQYFKFNASHESYRISYIIFRLIRTNRILNYNILSNPATTHGTRRTEIDEKNTDVHLCLRYIRSWRRRPPRATRPERPADDRRCVDKGIKGISAKDVFQGHTHTHNISIIKYTLHMHHLWGRA